MREPAVNHLTRLSYGSLSVACFTYTSDMSMFSFSKHIKVVPNLGFFSIAKRLFFLKGKYIRKIVIILLVVLIVNIFLIVNILLVASTFLIANIFHFDFLY